MIGLSSRGVYKGLISEAKETYEQKRSQYAKRGLELSEYAFIELCRLDPTSNYTTAGKYFDWLYKNNGNRVFIGIKDYLDVFDKGKVWLQRGGYSTNIMDYDMDGLMSVVGYITSSRLPMSKASKALGGEYEMMFKGEHWCIVRPDSWKAERYFGTGTNWCTVGNEFYYNAYSGMKKLFIVLPLDDSGNPIVNTKDKYQCSISEEGFNCADVNDHVKDSLAELYEEYPRLGVNSEEVIGALRSISTKFYPMDGDEDMSVSDIVTNTFYNDGYDLRDIKDLGNGAYKTTNNGYIWKYESIDEAFSSLYEAVSSLPVNLAALSDKDLRRYCNSYMITDDFLGYCNEYKSEHGSVPEVDRVCEYIESESSDPVRDVVRLSRELHLRYPDFKETTYLDIKVSVVRNPEDYLDKSMYDMDVVEDLVSKHDYRLISYENRYYYDFENDSFIIRCIGGNNQ